MARNEEVCHPNNALLFQLAITNSFKQIAECVSEDEFIDILSILKKNRSTAQKLYKAMIKELFEGMNDDLKDILKEGTLQDALTNISKLSEDSEIPVGECVWRPPGNVKLHLRSMDMEKMKGESEKLEERVNEIEQENGILIRKIAEKRRKVCAVDDKIIRFLNHCPFSLQRLGDKAEQLQSVIKTMDDD